MLTRLQGEWLEDETLADAGASEWSEVMWPPVLCQKTEALYVSSATGHDCRHT